MSRACRNLPRIDYNIFDKTGRKVFKKMADCEKEILSEAKLSADIGEFYEMNNLNELDSEEELYEAIDTVTKYSKMYRDVHTELKFKMQAGDYDGRYPKYDEVISKL